MVEQWPCPFDPRKSIKFSLDLNRKIEAPAAHLVTCLLLRGLLALESCVDANYQLSKGKSAETSGGLLVALPSLPSAQDKQ